jgi:hypothetical protein
VRNYASFMTQSGEGISQLPSQPLPQASGLLYVSVEESLFTSPKGYFSDMEGEDDDDREEVDVSQPINVVDTRSPCDR